MLNYTGFLLLFKVIFVSRKLAGRNFAYEGAGMLVGNFKLNP